MASQKMCSDVLKLHSPSGEESGLPQMCLILEPILCLLDSEAEQSWLSYTDKCTFQRNFIQQIASIILFNTYYNLMKYIRPLVQFYSLKN